MDNVITMNQTEAIQSVNQSNLTAIQKQNLLQFIQKFPNIQYTKLINVNQNYPLWLQSYQTYLYSFCPGKAVFIQFDENANILPNNTWFYENFEYTKSFSQGISSQHLKFYFKGQQVTFVAKDNKTLQTSLFIISDKNGTDTKVYELYLDMEEPTTIKKLSVINNQATTEGTYEILDAKVAFEDYSEMFSNIIKVSCN